MHFVMLDIGTFAKVIVTPCVFIKHDVQKERHLNITVDCFIWF